MAQKKTHQAMDGVPVLLKGRRVGGKSRVRFVQECCTCGLKHMVEMEHDGENPDIKATFTMEK